MEVKVDHHIVKKLEKGFAFLQQDKFTRAKIEFEQVLIESPRNEFALNLLGVCSLRLEQAEVAISFLLQALEINGKDPETHNNLGLAYKDLKQLDKAKTSFETSLKLNPNQPDTLNNLGNIFSALEQHHHAAKCFETALKLAPEFPAALNNFAQALKELGVHDVALQVINKACQVEPSNSHHINVKGELLMAQANYDEAKKVFKKAMLLDGSIVAHINLSTALKQTGEYIEAERALNDVINKESNNTEAHNHLGVLLEQLGRFDEAAICFRNALKHTSNHASSYYQLAKLKAHGLTENEVDNVHKLLQDVTTPSVFLVSLNFALAVYFDKKKDHQLAFEYFQKAQKIKADKSPYNAEIAQAYNNEMKNLMPLASYDIGREVNSVQPVFVIGMPRSGTSLTEQILSSHSQVFGAGELSYINDLVKQAEHYTQTKYPACLKKLSDKQLNQLGQTYKSRVVDTFGKYPVIIDKNPLNFNFTGFIKAILPDAKFIYCKRNAADNCISIFKLPFDDNQAYAHDLTGLGHYYRCHEQLMDLWKRLYMEDIIQINYEDMVNDQPKESKRLFKFLNLDYEKQSEEFYKTQRIVMTPSAEQVRQPIYKSSVNSWQKYGEAVKPLLDALDKYKG